MILGRIESIQIGRPRRYDGEDDSAKSWTSAIRKQSVDGPVHVGVTNIDGDEQADLKHHGGLDKAVLAYSVKHYDDWKREIPDVAFGMGGFGENLTISDCDEATCCIGDIVRIGDCQLQISQPRERTGDTALVDGGGGFGRYCVVKRTATAQRKLPDG